MNIKLIIAGVILLPVLAHLGYALANSDITNYYITVDEFVARSSSTPVRVAGDVVPGSIQWNNSTQTMRFQIAGETSRVDVTFRGYVPDSFRDGTTVVLEGSRGTGNAFLATSVAVRCPHQYLPAG